MSNFRITLIGDEPLLMHNNRLADPLDPATKALGKVTKITKKTEADHLEAARLEFTGGLYHDPDIGPFIPSDNIWRALYDAAKKTKSGPKIKEGIILTTPFNPLSYTGPRDIDGLWRDENFRHRKGAKVMGKTIMRTRPMFRTWAVEADGIYDPNVINFRDLQDIAATAGERIGLGDWRPRYGRFTATVEEITK